MTASDPPRLIVLHVAGTDRPGITARIAEVIAEENAHLVTIGQSVLHGYLMLSASSSFRVPLVFAGLLVVAALGIGMYAVAALLERRFTHWATRGMDSGFATGG